MAPFPSRGHRYSTYTNNAKRRGPLSGTHRVRFPNELGALSETRYVPPRERLLVAFDFGTGNASAVFARDTYTPRPKPVGAFRLSKMNEVRFEGTEPQMPTEMAYKGEWLLGGQVSRKIEDGDLNEDKRIKWLKLGLGDEKDNSKYRLRHQAQLARLPQIRNDENNEQRPHEIQDLISVLLLHMWEKTCKAVRNKWPIWAKGVLEDGDYECCLTVPALWTPAKIDVMIEAALTAGIQNVFVESEPACAVHTLLLQKFEQDLEVSDWKDPGSWNHELLDKPFIVVDLGAGTMVSNFTSLPICLEKSKRSVGLT